MFDRNPTNIIVLCDRGGDWYEKLYQSAIYGTVYSVWEMSLFQYSFIHNTERLEQV